MKMNNKSVKSLLHFFHYLLGVFFVISFSCYGNFQQRLWHGAANGNISEMSEALRNNARIDLPNDKGEIALMLAVKGKNPEAAVKGLLFNHADPNIPNTKGDTPLLHALTLTNSQPAKLLLNDQRTNIHYQNPTTGIHALHVAAQYGKHEEVRDLLQKGVDVNVRTSKGNTPLMMAMRSTNAPLVPFLLAHNADVNAQNNKGTTALMIAAKQGSPGYVNLLLEREANPALVSTALGTALTSAFASKNIAPNMLHTLITHTPQEVIDVRDYHGDTALHLAAQKADREAIRMLLEKGADPNIPNYSRNTPIMIAAAIKDAMILGLLLRVDSDLAFANENQQTALDIALQQGLPANTQLLINFGARIPESQKNNKLIKMALVTRAIKAQKTFNLLTSPTISFNDKLAHVTFRNRERFPLLYLQDNDGNTIAHMITRLPIDDPMLHFIITQYPTLLVRPNNERVTPLSLALQSPSAFKNFFLKVLLGTPYLVRQKIWNSLNTNEQNQLQVLGESLQTDTPKRKQQPGDESDETQERPKKHRVIEIVEID